MTKTSRPKKPSSEEKPIKDIDLSNFDINRRKEWRFDLELPLRVEGKLSHGKKFKEETTIQNISSGGAYFCLDSGISVGSKLNLVIEIPKELSGGKKLKLILGGLTVRIEKPKKKEKKKGIALQFHKKFKIIAEEEIKDK